MADEESTSYLLVNAQALPGMAGRMVTIVGRLVSIANNRATIETSDNGRVTAHLNQNVNVPPQAFIEVVGMAERDNSVRMVSYSHLSNDVDMQLLEEATRLQYAHLPLFDFPDS